AFGGRVTAARSRHAAFEPEQNRPMKRRRFRWLIPLLIPLLFVCLLGGWTYRQYRQERLNEQLIRAIVKEDTTAALAALDAGADPNARKKEAQNVKFWQWLWEQVRG